MSMVIYFQGGEGGEEGGGWIYRRKEIFINE